ncbi:MAG: hypothetical protein AB7E95_07935, partial [Kiritimatiellales bacterium]
MTGKKQRPALRGRTVRHLLRIAGFTVSLSILLILFSLLVIGLPDAVTRTVSEHFLSHGIPIRFDSIRLSTHHGWVLRNARIYSTDPDDLKPLFECRKLYLLAWPKD